MSGAGLPHWWWTFAVRVAVVDLAAVVIAVFAALVVRFNSPVPGPLYAVISVGIVIAWLVTLQVQGAYEPDVFGLGGTEFQLVFRATFVVFGVLAIASLVLQTDFSRGFLAVGMPLGLLGLLLGRVLNRRWLIRARHDGRLTDAAVVLGNECEVRYITGRMARCPEAGYTVRAVAVEGGTEPQFLLDDDEKVPAYGSVGELLDRSVLRQYGAVVVAGQSDVSRLQVQELGYLLEDTQTRLVIASQITDVAGPRIHWRPVEGLPLLSVEMPSYGGAKYALKRAFDVVVSTLLIVLFSPLMLAVLIAVKLDSPGPLFYRASRIGHTGRPFKMTKFRSMVADADQQFAALSAAQHDGNDLQFKLRDDPRVTRVGKVIRRYSLDELPQLFDVLLGTMSLVGPRPHVTAEVEGYAAHVRRRLNVKPGITGPWQVGGRSDLSWEDSVRKDLYYIENWSLSGDLAILLRTVIAVFASRGAY